MENTMEFLIKHHVHDAVSTKTQQVFDVEVEEIKPDYEYDVKVEFFLEFDGADENSFMEAIRDDASAEAAERVNKLEKTFESDKEFDDAVDEEFSEIVNEKIYKLSDNPYHASHMTQNDLWNSLNTPYIDSNGNKYFVSVKSMRKYVESNDESKKTLMLDTFMDLVKNKIDEQMTTGTIGKYHIATINGYKRGDIQYDKYGVCCVTHEFRISLTDKEPLEQSHGE